jgi:hypothetical protein
MFLEAYSDWRAFHRKWNVDFPKNEKKFGYHVAKLIAKGSIKI